MIEVYRTNVTTSNIARQIIEALQRKVPTLARFNFDLEDCDRIFRAEMPVVDEELIQTTFRQFGHHCETLED